MKTHGVIHINHIELDKNHRLTLRMLYKIGFLGNWVNTTFYPVLQIFKDVEDSNFITVTIYPDYLDIHTAFKEIKLDSNEWDELRATFNHAVALIGKIYYKNSNNLDAKDDYEIIADK